MKLGKLGVFANILDERSATSVMDYVRRLEQWGYSAVWMGEGFGRDVLLTSAGLLANTRDIVIASGIANIYARDPMAMRAAQLGLNEQFDGRFLLGVGVSNAQVVKDIRGHAYGRPIETMRRYLEAMRQATYLAPLPAEPPKTVVAALGPKMLALSRDAADGAHPYNMPPAHTAQARAILGPGKLLCVEQKVILERDPAKARGAARAVLGFYLQLPNYQSAWRSIGFGADDYANGGSDRLIDSVVAWGDERAIVSRIREHWAAGADHVCVHGIDADRPVGPLGFSVPDEKLLQRLTAIAA